MKRVCFLRRWGLGGWLSLGALAGIYPGLSAPAQMSGPEPARGSQACLGGMGSRLTGLGREKESGSARFHVEPLVAALVGRCETMPGSALGAVAHLWPSAAMSLASV